MASDAMDAIVCEGARLGCDVETLAQVKGTFALCVDAMLTAGAVIASTSKGDSDLATIMAAYDDHAQEADDEK